MRRLHLFFDKCRPAQWRVTAVALLMAGFSVSMHIAWAQSDPLSTLEQQLFNTRYSSQTMEERLSRLESSVFGAPQSGDIPLRQSRLLQVLQPSPPANAQPGNISPENTSASSPTQEPDATSYPSVTALERQVFSRDFIYDDVQSRLNRLEKKVFGTTFPNAALADRVDKLNARVPNAISTTYPESALDRLPASSSQFSGGNPDIYRKLDALERSVFNGNTYSGLMITERLDQLEQKTFGNMFSGESVDTRVSRLINGNRTGMQTSPRFQPQYAAPRNTARNQNIQIGTGFSSSSKSTMQYSPDLLKMLPPDLRQQLMSGQAQQYSSQASVNAGTGYYSNSQTSSGGYTASGNGTVVIQETREYPGFTPYGGQPMNYRNYYAYPGSQTQTTVLGPTGSYSYASPGSYGAPYPNGTPGYNGSSYASPMYMGNPQMLQDLTNLEINTYGAPQTAMPLSDRLNQLETRFLGQSYAGYSDYDRINNLTRAQQVQSIGARLGKGKFGKIGRTAGSFLLGVPMNPPASK